ncbi:hypothetical protein [Geobacter sp. DSM 9736]|uniref:hypothetical protein n=1 Tax=Geobacter sp. DSM 9736 TaxID=1277350 RepID=UPI000B50A023|nr:hypothetical protein [Geobacter sp. DSM 9736]SNB45694.1 hypothetical protein SAMN06269301_1122 [Geobacter sp. DSM 9736]
MTEPQKGVSRNKGTTYHVNLDRHSLRSLKGCHEINNAHGNDHSHSVIIRRALRVYYARLKKLKKQPSRYEDEALHLDRAAKGVV